MEKVTHHGKQFSDPIRSCWSKLKDESISEKESKNFFKKSKPEYGDESYYEINYAKRKPKQVANEKRCVQIANKKLPIQQGASYTVTMFLTLPETHYERLTANTPLYVAQSRLKTTRNVRLGYTKTEWDK